MICIGTSATMTSTGSESDRKLLQRSQVFFWQRGNASKCNWGNLEPASNPYQNCQCQNATWITYKKSIKAWASLKIFK